jgi:DNA repair exonuclease SbcCD ATPase subunit
LDADKTDFNARWDWHQRVIAVVGLKRYVDEANTQALALGNMSQRLKGILRGEEANFRADYQNQMRLALEKGDQLSALVLQLNGLQNQKANSESNLSERIKESDTLSENLKSNKEGAKRALSDLAAREKEIFLLLQQLKNAKDDIEALERELRSKEKLINK